MRWWGSFAMVMKVFEPVLVVVAISRPRPSPAKGLSSYLPEIGWALALLFFVLLIVRDAVRDALKKLIDAVITRITQRFSGSRLFRRRSIRFYCKKVAANLANIPVPFKLPVQIAMADVYIPLRGAISGSSSTQVTMDLGHAVFRQRRALILGIPGSGKSLFLRHLAWSLTSGPDKPNSSIPVIVPLNRLAAPGTSIQSEIVTTFSQNGFPRAEDFVARELAHKDSRLLVLFDGLDEVGSTVRAQVSGQISDFGDQHPGVRYVVTCRTAAYSGSIDGAVEEIFYVQDFSDELVDRFLYAWPAIAVRSSVDRLVNALRDTPRVAILVRNPLLLTMLAYLYSYEYQGSINMLPHNRTQFYKDATELLLRRWQEQYNEFPWIAKKVVLQHLALVNQRGGTDRREIVYEDILNEIISVLPRVNIAPDRAGDVLSEICLRSGILTSLDNGERFQFAHLTLQEYYAAIELTDKPETIIEEFRHDPTAWREPLKLWCGGEYDSTMVIRSVAATDEVLALECLADATRVEEAFATKMVERMKAALEGARPDDPLVQAFGLLASDRRPRGRQVFDFLVRRVSDSAVRLTFATALVATNLSDAADVIAEFASGDQRLVPLLEQMGNLAVPGLSRRAEAGERDALRSLTVIGTPRAARTLAELLWHPKSAIATAAAVELMQLSGFRAIEDSLTQVALPPRARADSAAFALAWAWEPFTGDRPADERHTLQLIFGRMIQLLDSISRADLENIARHIDARPAIFIFLFSQSGEPRPGINTMTLAQLVLDDLAEAPIRSRLTKHVGDQIREAIATGDVREMAQARDVVLTGLARQEGVAAQCELLRRAIVKPVTLLMESMFQRSPWRPVRRNWLAMLNPKGFRVNGSSYHRIPFSIVWIASIVSAAYVIFHVLHSSGWEMYLNIFVAIAIIAGLTYITVVPWQVNAYYEPWNNFSDAIMVCLLSPFCIVEDWFNSVDSYDLSAGAAELAFTPAWIYGLFEFLYHNFHTANAIATEAVVVAIVACLFTIGQVKRSRAYNPLIGVFSSYSNGRVDEVSESAGRTLPRSPVRTSSRNTV